MERGENKDKIFIVYCWWKFFIFVFYCLLILWLFWWYFYFYFHCFSLFYLFLFDATYTLFFIISVIFVDFEGADTRIFFFGFYFFIFWWWNLLFFTCRLFFWWCYLFYSYWWWNLLFLSYIFILFFIRDWLFYVVDGGSLIALLLGFFLH